MGRAPCCDKVGLNKGTWSEEEDAKLIAYVSKYGHTNWRALPKLAGLLRCGKSCRLRWFNYLRPDIKRGHFTEEEEETIIKLRSSLGNKWSKIASCLPGRTDNEIKNVWNTHLKKRVQQQPASDTGAGDEGPSDGRGEHALLFEIPIESSIDDLLSVPSSEAHPESSPCASSLTSSSSSKIDNVVDDGRQPSSAWLPDFPGLPELDQIWKFLEGMEEFEVERDQMGGGGGEGSTSEWLEYLEKELGSDEEAMRAAAEGDPDSSYIQAQSSNLLRY